MIQGPFGYLHSAQHSGDLLHMLGLRETKHGGTSWFLVPMDAPGIPIQPLINMAGQHGFNEVFFEDVRIPAKYLVGQENMGWYQLAVALDFERSSIAGSARARRIWEELLRCARENPAFVEERPGVRQRLGAAR